MSDLIYGVVANRMWYSNRMEFKMRGVDNGIYSMDMEADDFRETITPANIDDARKFFSKASKIQILRGISFHDGIIPENPVKFKTIPIKVEDPTFDEFEEVEIAILKGKLNYFLQVVYGEKSYALMDIKDAFEANTPIDDIKGVTPEMRVLFTFHCIERRKEELKKELLEPKKLIERVMSDGGAKVEFVKKNNRGWEVQWNMDGYTINTQLDKKYRVMEAGFCVSNWDGTQSASSLVNVLHDYTTDGVSSVYKTRTVQ